MTTAILKLSLSTVTVTVMLSLVGLHHVQHGRLQEATRLRAENDALRLTISHQRQSQLNLAAKREAQADASESSPPSSTPITEAGQLAPPAAELSRAPGTEYRHEGQATPIAALQTYAWACDHADTATMIHLIRFDDAARRKAVAYMATLPAEVQAKWNSPEEMAAALLIDEGIQAPFPGAAILALANTEVISEERVALLLPGTNRERTEFQKTADGWSYAITEKMADEYIAEHPVGREASRGPIQPEREPSATR